MCEDCAQRYQQDDEALEVKSLDRFYLRGRGWVHIVECPLTCNRDDLLRELSVVHLDGKLKRVQGVESYAIPIISKGTPVGLLIDDEGDDVQKG